MNSNQKKIELSQQAEASSLRGANNVSLNRDSVASLDVRLRFLSSERERERESVRFDDCNSLCAQTQLKAIEEEDRKRREEREARRKEREAQVAAETGAHVSSLCAALPCGVECADAIIASSGSFFALDTTLRSFDRNNFRLFFARS